MSTSDEQFIELVKQYTLLYDITSTGYRDHNLRMAAWEDIAQKLGSTGEQCKERWHKLRNGYTSALKRRSKKPGILPWKFEAHMDFLLPNMINRKTGSYIHSADATDAQDEDSAQESISSEDNESHHVKATCISPSLGSASVRPPSLSMFHTTSNENTNANDSDVMKEILDVMKSRQNRTAEMDETDHFFLFMSKQIKKLPKIDQSKIKFQMHKLIHDAEINMIQNTNKY